MNLSRRSLFGGFAALLAAPAIVRASSLMPVCTHRMVTLREWPPFLAQVDMNEVVKSLLETNELLAKMEWVEGNSVSLVRTELPVQVWRSLGS